MIIPSTQSPASATATLDVDAVLAKLTLKEKAELLSGIDFWHTAAVPRLGIPSIRLSDGPNGVRGTRFFNSVPSACLPCGTAIGATFDTALAREIGHLLGDEARAKGAHVVLGPTINIQRLALGGRGFESFSEDPALSGFLAASYCAGLDDKGIAATPKHFTCNDMEHERMAVDVIVTKRALHEIYLTPFRLAIADGHVPAVMTSYSKVNGTHASENTYLLEKVLRGSWGYNGLVMSDWFGTYGTSEAVNAGLDLEMPGPSRFRGSLLTHAVNANKVSIRAVNDRVRNVLELVKRAQATGIPENAPENELNRPEDRQLLRRLAADAIVLLKNDDQVLPFAPSKSVAVIGPTSRIATYCGGGSASLNPYEAVTPWEGIEAQAKGALSFAQGVYGHQMLPLLGKRMRTDDGQVGFSLRVYNDPPTGPPTPSSPDTRPLLETKHVTDSNMFFVDYNHPDFNKNGIWYADAEGTFTPTESGLYDFGLSVHGTGRLYVDGELLVENVENQRLGTSFLGSGTVEEVNSKTLEAGKTYRILVQWGCSKTSNLVAGSMIDFGHGGMRIGACRRLTPEDGIAEAVALAKTVDQVVLCVGLGAEWESEGEDRVTMDLPPNTDNLVAAVLAANPNTVVVVQSGTPVTLPWVGQAKAVLQAWYGGNETGNGIADVVFGAVNPAGKLPLTYPRRLEDNPAHVNYRSEAGRVLYGEDVYVGYRYFDRAGIEPLFPFGHGLSYTSFSLEDLVISQAEASNDVQVSVKVTNTGAVAGSCTVQLYVAPPVWEPRRVPAVPQRPSQELRVFDKVHDLAAGASAQVTLNLDAKRDTSYWDETVDSWCSREGLYRIRVGQSSRDVNAVEGTLTIKETTHWQGLSP
ncbi:hypothetical protein SBRCBS47491_007498 [Sporothrix bragantina]|uniref:Probable beta-glucosidase I n=1 Tax=Sporothrix bragantina TaxID=671064 RepID=A0ABP0CGD9_9PEZI